MTAPTLSYVRHEPAPRIATLGGLPQPVTFDLARSALVVVDMQNDFLHADGWFPSAGIDPAPLLGVIPQITELTAAARKADVPVLWLNWGVRADRAELSQPLLGKASACGTRPVYADPSPKGKGPIAVQGEWGAEVFEAMQAEPGDLLVYKHRLSGFFDNELDTILRNRGIDTLIFAGVNIDRCVFSTLCDASFHGYGCVLVEDACATSSPDYVREATLYLVRLLYGVTAGTADLASLLADHKS
ncbi:peroxyureidoacrylate/ureidoacrylate amidohydrolase RutB [Azorhizobium oxalatiphilum]|uniref:Peroxyureidoacrylate/ureidoacrylate amidohydrolase RutB n=1 Tax=Azorhizobium oxalatiphilum TaxID=980631 RepID=A0A917BZ95_9HYPH|nr:cysteine hydrolase family protein [Azorhizobium oxalatiphilum]GGF63002.1 peroxyureidoacrylate/ureidoacrylate amidohydrolase RutB [Azorhizobium oxalatiphilum]